MREHTRVLVVTGAGISAPSGIPTYRAAGSGWADPDLERISHISRYGNHLPALWQFWGRLRELTASAAPNAAHEALTTAQQRCEAAGGFLTVLTQNVDDLHGRAGTTGVIELHGSIHRSRCLRRSCGTPYPDATSPAPGQVPSCPRCARRTRPDVVLFGEQLAAASVAAARAALRQADLIVYVGTSGNVWPVAGFAEQARAAGKRTVLVNADPWEDGAQVFDEIHLGDAAEVLPRLLG